jgi:hypothetical protein
MKITPGISSIVLGRTNLFRLTIIVSQRLIDCAFEPKILAWRNDLDRFPRDRRWLVSGGTVIPQARLAGAEVGVLPGGDLVQMLADSLGGVGDRQDVLEQGGGHAEGDQGCPTALQIQQLRGSVLGEQLGQRADGLAVRRVAPAAVKARACERNMAKRGAEGYCPLPRRRSSRDAG